MEPPALIVVGDVVSLSDKLNWFMPMLEQPCYDERHASDPARA
jgi:hypothetical protein